MISLFRKPVSLDFIGTDLHSHLLAGIDDGVSSWDESLDIIQQLIHMGYKRLITTPHIMPEFYPNTPAVIREKLDELQKRLKENGLNFPIEAAAEYYADDTLLYQSEHTPEQLMVINNRYLLFELPVLNPPIFLKQLVFNLKASGITPVLAHPERYVFIQQDIKTLDEYHSWGMLLQLNLLSLAGYYGPGAKKTAQYMVDEKKVDIAGSDIHNAFQTRELNKLRKSSYLQKLKEIDLKNGLL